MKKKNTGYVLLACSALFSLSMATGASADAGKAESCIGCHEESGASAAADVPNIGGYSTGYITASLTAYKAKERPCVEATVQTGSKKGAKTDMCQAAKDLSDADMEQVAAYFAGKKFVRTAQKFDPAMAAKGKVREKLCAGCHSESGSVADDDAGILAGQKTAYIAEQIKLFKEGKRPIPKKMKVKLDKLNPAEIQELVDYYASLK